MCSRDPNLLQPELRRRMHCAIRDYRREFPTALQPIISCTVRSNDEQARLYAQGRTSPGRIVTWALPGESPHNENPSPAADIAFPIPGTDCCDWGIGRFTVFAEIAERYGIEWGGRWPGKQDACHFATPGWRVGGAHDPWPEMPQEETT